MRTAMTALALGAAFLMTGTSMASAGGDRARDMCLLDLMRHHVRADRAAPVKAAPKKAAPKKVAMKKAPAKKAPAKPLK